MTAPGRAVAAIAATLALAFAIWGWQPPDLAAQSQPTKKKSASASKPDASKSSPPYRGGGQGIVVVVNDDAITAYEIEQRARLLGLSINVTEQAKANFQQLVKTSNLEEKMKALSEEVQREVITGNPGKSREELIAIFKERMQERQKTIVTSVQKQAIDSARAAVMPKLKKDAREELIDDRLKLQAAKKHGLEVPDDEVKGMLKVLADRNKMTYDAFAQHLKGMSVDISTMTEKFRAQRAWRELVKGKFGAQVSVGQRDIDQLLATAASEVGQDAVELQLQKLSFSVPGKSDQAALTKRIAEAEAVRRRFAGCKNMSELVKGTDVKVHELKYVKPSTISEPTRSLLLAAKDNDVLPPVTTGAGVDLYAVCGRKSAANDSLQAQAKAQLQEKQLDIFGQRYLRNLRQEANIEYK
jgi:peptidyl-prolyl cis-trans isomerase SurA